MALFVLAEHSRHEQARRSRSRQAKAEALAFRRPADHRGVRERPAGDHQQAPAPPELSSAGVQTSNVP